MAETTKIERTYNAISPRTARRLASTLRRHGYQVRQARQWVYVQASALDTHLTFVTRQYQAIAY